jgi:uncharacterized protein (TIGR03437 family)
MRVGDSLNFSACRAVLLFSLIPLASAQQYTISTVAGIGRLPFVGAGGSGVSAPLVEPFAVAADSSGNVYVSDQYFHQVFRISASGTITVYAGSGQPGFSGDNGLAVAAQLNTPGSLAVDTAGNLYISDTGNARIREVAPSGTITTFASIAASGLALDQSNNIYVSTGNTVGRISSSGTLTVIAGTGKAGYGGDGGAATAALLSSPAGLRVDPLNNIYVADTQNQRIRKITPQGNISTVAGNGQAGYAGDSGPANAASITLPEDIALDASGNLLIADSSNFVIRMVNATTGSISTIAGGGTSFQNGAATQAFLQLPTGLAIDNNGNLIIALQYGREVRRVVQGSITTIAGTSPSTNATDNIAATADALLNPFGVVNDGAGNLYVTDTSDNRIREISAAGIITTFAGTGVFGDTGNAGLATGAEVGTPRAATFDPSGNLYFASGFGFRIRRIAATGTITEVAGSTNGFGGDGGNALSAKLLSPLGLAADATGAFYIADSLNNRIRRVDPLGNITTIAGTGAPGYSGDNGPAMAAQLLAPRQLALDSKGNLYVADTGNNAIRKFSPGGTIMTVAGTGVAGGTGDGGPAIAAQLTAPTAVALDAAGNLYIGTSARIRRVDATTGVITTIAGTGSYGFSGDGGLATAAAINTPQTLNVDSSGNIYFVDQGNLRVRKLAPLVTSSSTPVIALVANAFGDTPLIAPNTWVEIKGLNLAPRGDSRIWQGTDFVNNLLPQQLDGVSVMVNGKAAYVYYISPTQVNILTPPDAMSGPVAVQLVNNGVASNLLNVQAAPQSLSFFNFVSSAGLDYVYGRHGSDGSLIGPTSLYTGLTTPVKPGEVIFVAGNGFGQTTVPVVSGAETQSGTLPQPWPVVAIGGINAPVSFAGLVGVGTYQFNLQVPTNAPDGDLLLTATYNGLQIQAQLLITVQH